MGKYTEYDKAALSAGWRAVLVTVAVLVVCGGLGWAGWAIKVATSDVKGAGDAQVKINSAENRIQSQELFEAMYTKIQEYDKNLDAAAAKLALDPKDKFASTEYFSLIQTCNAAVQQYNAEARKVSRGKWMSADLPYEIDQSDVRFDCKETGAR